MDNTESAVRMEDLVAQFVDSDAVSQIISTTPFELQAYALAVADLNEFPLPQSTVEVIDGKPYFHDLNIPFSTGLKELTPLLSKGSFDDIIKELSKDENIIESLTKQHCQNVKAYIGHFAPLKELPLVEDIDLIRRFANSASLANGFSSFCTSDGIPNMLPRFTKKSQDKLQAALACKMAGMSKTAEMLLGEFFEYQLVNVNDGFQALINEIQDRQAQLKKLKEAAKKGGLARQLPSKETKEQALALFWKGTFKNYSAACSELFPKIKEIAKKNGAPFNSDVNGMRVVTDWFRETKRYMKLLN